MRRREWLFGGIDRELIHTVATRSPTNISSSSDSTCRWSTCSLGTAKQVAVRLRTRDKGAGR